MKKSLPYKWELVIILWLAYFFNQGDRQIFNAVIPLIKKNMHLSDVEIGTIATIFTIVYGCVVPFAGFASDLLKRKWIVFFSLLIFSVGTLLTGFSGSLFSLILIRGIVTGGGEAVYYPAATSLISQYHQKTRAMALSIHQTSLYVGIVASGFIAAYIGERMGWRYSFYTFGMGGLILVAYVFFRVKDVPQEVPQSRLSVWRVAKHIFAKKTVWMLCLAFGAMVFVNVGFVTWMATFYFEKFHLSLATAGFTSMFFHFGLAFLGVLIGGKLSDKFSVKRKTTRLETEFIGLLFGAPFIFIMARTPSLYVSYAALAAFGFFRGIYDSNLFAALFDVIEPGYRASSVGVMTSFAFLTGAFAPLLLGIIKTQYGLSVGIGLLSVFYLVAAVLILLAILFYFKKDYYDESPA
ncbi:MFS transporter [Flavisolibacter ginsenosidimutans]|uniref:MFS transporter n=1 Tax=Flavisolibacter ginsenosidimutans TaxID=661481 RepID=A0A5B8UJU3_9BACT|nr:MFS transporter [Flavisolibacter ginsenosidimutans]QEC56310.1 MFS transporter [Flavisolibacter ginsenosidimutans]